MSTYYFSNITTKFSAFNGAVYATIVFAVYSTLRSANFSAVEPTLIATFNNSHNETLKFSYSSPKQAAIDTTVCPAYCPAQLISLFTAISAAFSMPIDSALFAAYCAAIISAFE